jgi:hypothetical protein
MRVVEFSKDDPTWLTCPHCRGNNLYHGSVTVFSREREDGPVTARTVTDHGVYRSEGWAVDDANPSSRRGGCTIAFECEACNVTSELTIAQHKGVTILKWRVTGRRLEDRTYG